MKKIMKCENVNYQFPPQRQNQPGLEYLMNPMPVFDNYKGSNKLKGKVAIITGGDSGIGRAVAVAYAKEGSKVVIVYFNEEVDALYTKNYINNFGGEVLLIEGDLKEPSFSDFIVKRTCEVFGKPDILVNNAGVQIEQEKLEDISDEQFDYTLKSNMYSMFYLTKRVLGVMNEGSIINVSSVTTFVGEPNLIDYVTSKGAIIGFTRSLSTNLAQKNIRVNAVAPGTFWTPLQPSTWKAEKMPILGTDNPMKRAAQPAEIAAIFVYLASDEASYTTGQVFHINGGQYKG